MSDDLDDLIRRVDPDRWLSSRFVGDAGLRADVIAIYAYDHELARAPKVASNSLLGEIRLTWWREMLDEAYEGRHVRHHPTAQALADVIQRHSLPREPLEAMIDARYRELDATPLSKADASALAFGTAGAAADLAIRVLGGASEGRFASGWSAMWALSRLMADGRVGAADMPEALAEVRVSIAEARTVERRDVSSDGFPAVAHATLAPLYAAGKRFGPLEKQLRLVWAVAIGRI
ncbi:MAG: squalene/phytoene synthase family protein [Alphaproteobacteria bacterium]|nr:squalene/phytoene synthase family protein [Alphaproteobacteria bacterium]MBU1513977.1 squalene/phytoene synthase family protein [Alphaproteobacteria bacterium]MBU2093083.1 squalene/phytoene synthase family protein [Alphaproteobacteria bacterium]MBU2151714.1 squalene/phytoene synthase family protein [Alphaproteobacteria bacterium]MBU2309466.1 squalene/phytoene synthase family protein [Alphaproteobacteria bacterium]